MSSYIVGHIRVKDAEKWMQYKSQVPATLQEWNAELMFRARKVGTFSGQLDYDDMVVIRFPDQQNVNGWFHSDEYQALIPLRTEAADMLLLAYDEA